MAIEAAFIKPIIDVVLAGLKKVKGIKVKKKASSELSEVIQNLLLQSPDLNDAEAKIQAAKAAGVISKELILVQKMISKHRVAVRPAAKKVAAKKPAAKKAAAKKPAAKKAATKKPAAKKA
jgi:cell division septation protein DedD